MTEKELIEMVIIERIDTLLTERRNEKGKEAYEKVYEKGERIIEGLDEENRVKIEEYIDAEAELDAEGKEAVYLGGVRDGVRLMAQIWEIVRD